MVNIFLGYFHFDKSSFISDWSVGHQNKGKCGGFSGGCRPKERVYFTDFCVYCVGILLKQNLSIFGQKCGILEELAAACVCNMHATDYSSSQ